MIEILYLIGFAILAFLQNMAFTWVSRSRNSGDPSYHRWAAYCSNLVWLLTNSLLTAFWIKVHASGQYWKIAIVGLVYTAATSEGSVYMMRVLLKKETGKRKVGSG